MTDFLIKRFVKDYQNIDNVLVREAYGRLSGIVGIVLNIVLFLIKLAVGIVSGSIAIIGDAIHNLADSGASIVTLLGFRLASRPADESHPYGHGRIEYIAGLIIAGVILVIGVELLQSSIDKVLNPTETTSSPEVIIILLASICLQLWLGLFNKGLGIRINSPAMLAASKDSLSDCLATVVVIICQIIHFYTGLDLDGHAGVLVSLFIMHSGYTAAKDTLDPLLGSTPDQEFVRDIRKYLVSNSAVLGVHDIIVHNYGPGRVFVSLHTELPASMNLMEAHNIVDRLEKEMQDALNATFTIHIDPVDTNNKELNSLKEQLIRIVGALDSKIAMHDLRMVKSDLQTTLFFEVSVPFTSEVGDDEVLDFIKQEMDKYSPGIKLDITLERISTI